MKYFLEDEENYIQNLSEEDLLDNLLPLEEAKIIKNISRHIPFEYTITTNLRDSRKYTYFRDHKKMHFCIENNHVIELEIILNDSIHSDQYHEALFQVKNLKYLKELAIYYSYKYLESFEKEFVKAFSISRNQT